MRKVTDGKNSREEKYNSTQTWWFMRFSVHAMKLLLPGDGLVFLVDRCFVGLFMHRPFLRIASYNVVWSVGWILSSILPSFISISIRSFHFDFICVILLDAKNISFHFHCDLTPKMRHFHLTFCFHFYFLNKNCKRNRYTNKIYKFNWNLSNKKDHFRFYFGHWNFRISSVLSPGFACTTFWVFCFI